MNVLAAVYEYRALTTPQIERLCFRGIEHATRVAQRRLQRLFHTGYLQRIEQPQPLSAGSKPFVYMLDKDGAAALSALADVPFGDTSWNPRDNHVGWPFLRHLLTTNDLRLNVAIASDIHGFRLVKWTDDKSLRERANTDYVQIANRRGPAQRAAVVPDGYFRLQTNRDTYNFLVEVDLATVTGQASVSTRRDWARKIRIYLEYYRSGRYAERYGTRDLRILVVTTGPRRAANLREITERVGGRNRFWFATLQEIDPLAVLTARIWHVAGRDGLHALVSP